MTVYLPVYNTHTAQGPVHCSCVMPWWACNSPMSLP